MIRFYRAHGLGNDYVVLEPTPSRASLPPSVVRLLCDRHQGLGSDGILLSVPSQRAAFGVRIYNPDGSEAEKSGNGVRIFARYLYDAGHFELETTLETLGGIVTALARPQLEGPPSFRVDMGPPDFSCAALPARGLGLECIDQALPELPDFPGTAVSVGNPHFTMFVPDVQAIPLLELGPRIENHACFPRRTNVQFAQVLGPGRVRVRIWERGAGETLASGSSACAVVAAGLRTGRLSGQVQVEMDGGTLEVEQDDRGHLHQSGPVRLICTGQLSAELEAELEPLMAAG